MNAIKEITINLSYFTTMYKKYFLIVFCLLIAVQTVFSSDREEEVKTTIEKAKDITYINPEQAVYLATKAIGLLATEEKSDLKAQALLVSAQADRLLGNFDSSIKSLFDALEFITFSDKSLEAQIYSMMGILYGILSDYNKAFEYNDKATSIFKMLNDSASIALCYNNRGLIYYFLDEFHNAEQFLNQSLKINRSLQLLRPVAANLNNLSLFESKGSSVNKLDLIKEAIAINKNLNLQWSLGENYNNMGKQYYFHKQYDKAIEALGIAYSYASSLEAKDLICDNYEYLSMVYAAKGDYERAYYNLTKLDSLSREIQSGNKLRTVEREHSQKQFLNQKRRADLNEQAYKIELLRRNVYVLLVVLVLFIAITIFFSKWYKQKKSKELIEARYSLEQSEREIAELKVAQKELELKTVKSTLEDNRKDATNLALFLRNRNELLEKIRDMVKEGYKLDSGKMPQHLKSINTFILQNQRVDKMDNALLVHIDDKNKEFEYNLTKLHPELTKGEKHLAKLLRIHLSTKEISALTGRSPKTVNMNRYRLRKSLNLLPEDNLIEYLQNI